MGKKETPIKKLNVKKGNSDNDNNANVTETNNSTLNESAPNEQEKLTYKEEYEKELKEFQSKNWVIGESNAFGANKIISFLEMYLKTHASWNKNEWMGILKMQETIDLIKSDISNITNGFKLSYDALEFCGYMLYNPGGIGYESAKSFENQANEYAEVFEFVGAVITEAREDFQYVKYLQERWAAAEQGFRMESLTRDDIRELMKKQTASQQTQQTQQNQ